MVFPFLKKSVFNPLSNLKARWDISERKRTPLSDTGDCIAFSLIIKKGDTVGFKTFLKFPEKSDIFGQIQFFLGSLLSELVLHILISEHSSYNPLR